MKLKIKEGTTSKLVRVFIQDSSSTTGAGLTGLVFNSAGLTAYYLPEGDASATSITLATMTVGTWATGGFKEVDVTNMPGVYEIGLPDAVVDATSEGSVLVMLKGATNMAPVLLEIELDSVNYRDGVRFGLTALPNAAAGAAGGLPTDSTGKTSFNDIAATAIVSAGAITTSGGAVSSVTTTTTATNLTNLPSIPANWLTAAGTAADYVSEVQSGLATPADITTALNTYDGPTNAEMTSAFTEIKGATWSSTTDTLEAIRDRGDAAWTTGAGGSDRLLMADTTIATLATQTSFTLTAGSADDNAYSGCTIVIEDVSTSTQKARCIVDTYTGATKTVTLLEAPAFTIAALDKVYILAEASLKPTTAANFHVDINATGTVGIDWGNIDNPTTAVDLSATDIQLVDTVTTYTGNTPQTADHTANIAAILDDTGTNGVVVASGSKTGYALSSTGADLILKTSTFAQAIVDAVWDELYAGHTVVGSFGEVVATEVAVPTVAQIRAEIDSNSTQLATIVALADSILLDTGTDGVVVASGSKSGYALSATGADLILKTSTFALAMADAVWDETMAGHVTADTSGLVMNEWQDGGRLDALLDTAAAGGGASASAIADAVWDEARSGHTTAGTFGLYLDAQVSTVGGGSITNASVADAVWDEALSGHTTSGTFGARWQEGDRYTNTDANIVYLTRGDSYDGVANAKLAWAVTKDFTTGWTGTMTIRHRTTDAVLGSVSIAVTSAVLLNATWTISDTAFALLTSNAEFGPHPYDIEMVSGSSEQTIITGVAILKPDRTQA